MMRTAIILAGGKSTRFGRDKTVLTLQGKHMVVCQVNILAPLFDEIIVVSNAENKYKSDKIKEVADIYKECGPMGGIHAGLSYASYNTCFVVACDMPFLNLELVKRLLQCAESESPKTLIIPKNHQKIEPLYGIYQKAWCGELEENIKQGKRKLTEWIQRKEEEGHVKYILVNSEKTKCFFNINTEREYEQIKRLKKDE